MAKIIDVPGMGQVEFPDTMSDDQIVQAIQRNSMDVAKQTVSEPPTSLMAKLAMGMRSAWVTGLSRCRRASHPQQPRIVA